MRKSSAEWESLISLKENGLRKSLRRKTDVGYERSKLSCSRNQIILISIFYLNLSTKFYMVQKQVSRPKTVQKWCEMFFLSFNIIGAS